MLDYRQDQSGMVRPEAKANLEDLEGTEEQDDDFESADDETAGTVIQADMRYYRKFLIARG